MFQANLTELKSFGAPPAAVVNVVSGVMVLLAPGGKVAKDRSWKAAKSTVMSKVRIQLQLVSKTVLRTTKKLNLECVGIFHLGRH